MTKKLCTALIGAFMACLAQAAPADSTQAPALRAKFASLADALKNNPYKRPIHIESAEASGTLIGDVYAVLDHPFISVSTALTGAAPWCDIMIMPVNTKDCRVAEKGGATGLTVRIGRKFDQPVKDAYPIEFLYKVAETSPDYFAVRLDAASGPLGTHDYRVLAEATPGGDGKTLLHLHYSYGYGAAGRFAMQAYLATAGADKVGFTSTGTGLIKGMRGVVERNTMRYYLAIDAYLDAAAAPSGQRVERRLSAWFDSSEQYARQLHEIDRSAYLAMKRREVLRQQTALENIGDPAPSERL
jgi:hypothetical protein